RGLTSVSRTVVAGTFKKVTPYRSNFNILMQLDRLKDAVPTAHIVPEALPALAFFGAINCQASRMCAARSSSLMHSRSTPIHPRTPTYGGLKYVFGSCLISAGCNPGAAGIQTAT